MGSYMVPLWDSFIHKQVSAVFFQLVLLCVDFVRLVMEFLCKPSQSTVGVFDVFWKPIKLNFGLFKLFVASLLWDCGQVYHMWSV